ncbi:MAG TPA: sigma-70 family RNA polymerase sigma factor [Lacipirellula sp.]
MADPDSAEQLSTSEIAKLWVEHAPVIAAYVQAEVRDRHHAEDVMQEIGQAVAQGSERYDPQRPFINWLFGVARNQLLRYFQKQAREKTVFSSQLVDKLADAYSPIVSQVSERSEALRECVKHLTPRQREAIGLFYRDEFTYAQIGEQMQMTPSAVGVLVHRARGALLDCIHRKLSTGKQ